MFGDIDYVLLSQTLNKENRAMGQTLFIIFETLVSIVLLNVVIAMMTNTFQAVVEDAEGDMDLTHTHVHTYIHAHSHTYEFSRSFVFHMCCRVAS